MSERRQEPSIARMLLTLVGAVAGVALGLYLVVLAVGAMSGPPPAVSSPVPRPSSAATAPAVPATDAMTASLTPAPAPTATVTPVPVPASTPKAVVPKPKPAYVVVIDPGHQAQGDNTPEPIGPGSSKTKPAVASGAAGVVAPHVPEHTVNLQVSLKLRDILEKAGVKVVMVRTTENVNIANSERARIGNRAHADLVVRVHCDDVTGSGTHGLMTVVPDSNQWTGPILASSTAAGRAIQKATLATTGAYDRGVKPPPEPMTGFNFSTVPSVIVEMGLMSNPAEDRKLTDAVYQGKLAQGMANGVMDYLRSR